jgi:hypothetical protein
MSWTRGQAYSQDLRDRVLASVDGGLGAYKAAALFNVSSEGDDISPTAPLLPRSSKPPAGKRTRCAVPSAARSRRSSE